MKTLLGLLTRIEAALSLSAAVILFAVMLIVAADVGMRYAFNQPFSWSYDLISLYLVLALFYFCLSRAFATHAHVGVDILHYYVSQKTRRLFELIAVVCWHRAQMAFTGHDVMAGAIEWPSWAFIILAPIGTGLLTMRLLLNGIAHAMALFGGPELIPLPALARSDEGLDQAAFE
jgi:TRAP-type C4-dicarboxylate transport system permease small subunit